MDRRQFSKVCGSLLAGASALSRDATASSRKDYPKSRMVDINGDPVPLDSLAIGSSHIFRYPYVTTPCFLIRLTPADYGIAELTDRTGQTYEWKGGVGADRSLVAFSAICSHKMSHPAKPISHLNFRQGEKEYVTVNGDKTTQSQLITCCSEYSIYDPANGASVVSGPATQPLAAIALEVDDDGFISATGSYGGDMYDAFLTQFGFRLAMEHGVSDPATLIGGTTEVTEAESFSRQQILC